MNKNNQFSDEDWSIPIPLTSEILHIARQFANEQANPKSEKAQQVYLNTIAICAVNNYLRIIGISTDITSGDSWNSSIRLIEDVADLWVTGKGSLECRPVKKGASKCHIPSSIGLERIGFVIVEIDEEQNAAILKGFTSDELATQYLSLHNLRSIEYLPSYLYKLKPLVNLSKWFQNIFENGWEAVETVLSSQMNQPAIVFRGKSKVNRCQRCKLIKLGNQEELVALIITVTPESKSNINILIELKPHLNQNYLPANLQIMLLDEYQQAILDTKTEQSNQHIQLDLSGEPGERFTLQIALGKNSFSEHLII
ncbi:Protein of unknown function (DUF1822) [Rivularia sp. PCC 7116]|uniref:DUF1822 family protein n=1 Tax=Rivularia sp. PCC 7116 TaxID=373994 RepID=UPI00029ED600|nr:DUF1822 family protein [Rivularia sp. PCC 7116]AFY58022.1 Protein of unknown function (DUF1822) [Rivularia sp. PCC 7116]